MRVFRTEREFLDAAIVAVQEMTALEEECLLGEWYEVSRRPWERELPAATTLLGREIRPAYSLQMEEVVERRKVWLYVGEQERVRGAEE